MPLHQTREQRLMNMASLTLCDPANGYDGEPGTAGHSEPGEPWSAPVMVLAGEAAPLDGSGGTRPWLYLACRCGWWLGYGPQYDPAEFVKVAAVHGERCELNPAKPVPVSEVAGPGVRCPGCPALPDQPHADECTERDQGPVWPGPSDEEG
jgi:hypothetical protein